MNEQKLKQIEQELMNGINKENDLEAYVVSTSKDIANLLTNKNKVVVDIKGKDHIFAYNVQLGQKGKRYLYLVVADQSKFKLLQQQYKPWTVTAEVDNDFSMYDNLQSIIEAFLRHKFDIVKVGEID